MMIQLCTCDKYPEPHDHARPGVLIDGEWVPHIMRLDGTRAVAGDVVRTVHWQAEGERLAEVLRGIPGQTYNENTIIEALDRWNDAVSEDGHALGAGVVAHRRNRAGQDDD